MLTLFPYSFNIALTGLLDLIGVYLAFWVYFANRKKALNRGFLLFILPNLLWINFYNLAFLVHDPKISLLFTRLTFTSVFIFFVGFYYFFIIWLLEEKGKYVLLGKIIIIYEIIFGFLCATTNLVIESSQMGKWGVIPTFSFLGSIIFHFPVIILVVLVIERLITRYMKSSVEEKRRIQYFLLGVFIFVFGNLIIGVILPFFFHIYDYYFLTSYTSIILLICTAYAIVRHNLFDIKIVASQLLVFVILIFEIIRTVLSGNRQELLLNSFLTILVFITSVLLLRSMSKEVKLTKDNLKLEQELRNKLVQKTGEMIKKMEDIVKE